MAWPHNNTNHVTTTTRHRILNRDGHQCAQCGTIKGPFDIDHKNNKRTPTYNHESNLQVLCKQCHKVKTQQESGEWRRQIKRRPRTPIGLS